MGTGERFTDEQLQQIIDAVQVRPIVAQPAPPSHVCRFNDREAKLQHGLADALENGGLENFRMLLEFGQTLRQIRKWGTAAIIATVIAAALTAFWAGVKASLTKGG